MEAYDRVLRAFNYKRPKIATVLGT